MKKIVLLALCTLALPRFCFGADFRNLGFDDVETPGSGLHGNADPEKVLPGWTLLLGEKSRPVYVNPFDVVETPGDHAALGERRHFPYAEGKFALRLFRSKNDSPAWTLAQIGTIPAGTQFLAYSSWGLARMQVWIDDEIILPLDWELPAHPGVKYLVYDVSQFAGLEVRLAFVGPFGQSGWPGAEGRVSYLDSITLLSEAPKITAEVQRSSGGKTNEVTLRFAPIAGRDIWVQFKDDLSKESVWQSLPGGPHNSGTVIDKSPAPHRIYRLKVLVPWE